MIRYYIFFFFLSLGACVQNADNVKLPADQGSKLVVGCFISPQDSVITATVTKSHSPYGYIDNTLPEVKDAQVIISDGSITKQLIYNEENSNYRILASEFIISPGKSYSLIVSSPGMKEVIASATIPATINNTLQYEEDSLRGPIGGGENNYALTLKWKDISPEINYYHTGITVKGTPRLPGGSDSITMKLDFRIISDPESIDGSFSHREDLSGSYAGDIFGVKSYDKSAFLLTTDANYYNYYRWLSNPGGGPFSEPKITFTNINGGLGVFAGYQKYVVQVR